MSTLSEPSYRKRVAYQAGLLGGFSMMAATLLIIGNQATFETIAERQAEDLQATLAQVVPPSLHDNNLPDDVLILQDADGAEKPVYQALRQYRPQAFAFAARGYGYAGAIDLMMGVDAQGRILGVRVLKHAETPGLGDKIEIARDDWITAFNGRSLQNTGEAGWQVKKDGGDFDQFSGATITPRAVVRAVHQGLLFFETHQQALSTATAKETPHEQ